MAGTSKLLKKKRLILNRNRLLRGLPYNKNSRVVNAETSSGCLKQEKNATPGIKNEDIITDKSCLATTTDEHFGKTENARSVEELEDYSAPREVDTAKSSEKAYQLEGRRILNLKTSYSKLQERPLKGIEGNNVDEHFLSLKDDSNKIQKEIKQIDRTADRITPSSSNNKNEDEFDSFGKYIAASLRLMPQEYAIITKTELQKTITDIQLKIVREKMNAENDPQSSIYNTNTNDQQRSQSPCDGDTTSSDDVNEQSECSSPSPTSDSCVSTIKIEYDNDTME